MYKLRYILIFIGLFSCKSNSIAQEKENNKTKVENHRIEKPKIKMPGLGDPRDNEITNRDFEVDVQTKTSRIDVIGLFVKFYEDKKICDTVYKATIGVKVDQVIKSERGVSNALKEGQGVDLVFMKSHSKDFDRLKQKFTKDQRVLFKVRERKLCFDSAKTVYEIITFEIIN